MICKSCGEGNHNNCKNAGTDTETWCDCQHKESSVYVRNQGETYTSLILRAREDPDYPEVIVNDRSYSSLPLADLPEGSSAETMGMQIPLDETTKDAKD